MRILLIEDDTKIGEFVSRGLREAGHVCDMLSDGQDGLFHAIRETYDVYVIDRMLPGLDGLSIVRSMRAAGVKTPALFLSAIAGIDDRVEGLEAGADDYLVKPFAFSELLARVNALARRPPAISEKTLLQVADLTMDVMKRRVTRAGVEIELQPREFTLLEVLARNEGRVRHPDDASRARMGFPFRSEDQRGRNAYQQAARQDRQALRRAAPAYDQKHRLFVACAAIAFCAAHRFDWR